MGSEMCIRDRMLGENEMRRCVILHGIADSGKSWIAKIMHKIFDAYWTNEPIGTFNEKITPLEANKQLIIFNEANMSELFKKKNITNMKKLTEGLGMPLNNKYAHQFTGHIGSYQLLTCNYLCSPFVDMEKEKAGYNPYQEEHDKKAMLSRTSLVKFDTDHKDMDLSFNEKAWAQCLLYLAKNMEQMPEPVEPIAMDFEQLNDENQDPNHAPLHMPESVLFD